jgi:hypothetical protein
VIVDRLSVIGVTGVGQGPAPLPEVETVIIRAGLVVPSVIVIVPPVEAAEGFVRRTVNTFPLMAAVIFVLLGNAL